MYRKTPKGWLKHWDFIILEFVVLQISYFVAYLIRHGINDVFQTDSYRISALIILFVDVFTLFFFDSLKDVAKRGYLKELTATVKHNFIVVAVCALVLFVFKRSEEISRFVVLYAGCINVVLTFLTRIIYKKILKKVLSKRMYKTLLIISSKDKIEEIVKKYTSLEINTFHVVGLVITDDATMVGQEIEGIPVVCPFVDSPDYAGREWIDEVLLMINPNNQAEIDTWKKLSETGITIHLCLSNIYDIDNRPKIAQQFAGMPVLTTSINNASTKEIIMKRIIDLCGGLVGSLITIILAIVFGPIIFISSPGNIFFTQDRIGKNGKHFKIIKFRTMYLDAEERKKDLMQQNSIKDGMMFKMDFDPRIIGNKILADGTHKTGIGQFIRNHSIDEFPQFFNVLAGQMSLVGTRPPISDEWDKYQLHHRARLAIKPGITGFWQVSGRSDITDFEEVVKLDTDYITNWSLGRDIRILFKTIAVVFSGNGAR